MIEQALNQHMMTPLSKLSSVGRKKKRAESLLITHPLEKFDVDWFELCFQVKEKLQ